MTLKKGARECDGVEESEGGGVEQRVRIKTRIAD